MGKLTGAYDSQELDRPDLNKCPECGCFFAGDNCPLCGMLCPEEFRAGNRKKVKPAKKSNDFQSSRVTFVPWYYSWWFILLMFWFMPIVGIILLATSPHKKKTKVTVVAVCIALWLLGTVGVGLAAGLLNGAYPEVDTKLSKDEYIAKCSEISAERYFRSPSEYEDEFVTLTLAVKERFSDFEGRSYYVCSDIENSELEIIVKDCRENTGYFVSGDIITIYGEGRNSGVIYDSKSVTREGPVINARFIKKN